MTNTNLTCWMLCGVPASGKSTWISNQNFNLKNTVVISTDDIIERRAKSVGKTYSDVFKKESKSAASEMDQNLKKALISNKNIVWDQTNTTIKIRAKKLSKIPDEYTKIGVFFQVPPIEELTRRLNNRPGKIIPYNIVMGMIKQLEKPTEKEGFDEIIII